MYTRGVRGVPSGRDIHRYTPMGGTLVGIYTVIHPWEAHWWVYTTLYTHGRHTGGYTLLSSPWEAPWWGILPLFSPWEAPWWVYTALLTTLGGTLVGISLFSPPWEAPWWALFPLSPTLGGTLVGVIPCSPTLGGTLVGIYLPIWPRYHGGYIPPYIHPPRHPL